jgi:hypothetical protein
MVDYLRSNRRLRNARKLRLFVVASCRRHWALLTDERSREAVEVAELYADGLATDRQREVAARAARAAQRTVFRPAFKASCAAAAYPGYAAYYGANRSADLAECALLRDLFGPSPFHPMPLINSDCLIWNEGTVSRVAQSIYDDRAFDRLPILADALEDAGCDHIDILTHCRQPGEHVRGCWVVDLLLGKE